MAKTKQVKVKKPTLPTWIAYEGWLEYLKQENEAQDMLNKILIDKIKKLEKKLNL